ncbi:muellerian-inhibiting factor [Solea solea]|uniref:muellerian-inhibiting factor n=1 Tax=Solea solea TaxID=90069 RepID=UPI00272B158C|nr:muellerian-inhibiting factor [Solea solea]
MLFVTLCWTWLCVAPDVSHGQQRIQDHNPTMKGDTVSPPGPLDSPCYVDDVFAALREAAGNDGELLHNSFTLFGICTPSDNSLESVLQELAKAASRNQRIGLEVLHPTGVLVGENDRGTLMLTFDLPQSPLLRLSPVLLLTFESLLKAEDLDATFTSQSLQPNTQSVCISGETRHILLSGKASEGNDSQRWTISVETKSPHMKQNLKDVLIGEKSGSNANITPLLLLTVRNDARHVSASSSASSQTFTFLCELKRFLVDVLPQDKPLSPQLMLGSLQSLPPLSLGLSSSETLLAELINSSSPTIFSFRKLGSTPQLPHGQLALSPALLEEIGQRLDQSGLQVMELIREEEVGPRATARLGRLKELGALEKKEPTAGESQYRAFLLLKALRTVAQAYELRVGQRTTRADSDNPVRANVCGLRSLTVSLERFVLGPNTAVINNCRGSCAFPMVNTINHAVLLNSHIENVNADERAPCCVPVAYEALEVVDLNEHGTYLSIKPSVIAKECGCR